MLSSNNCSSSDVIFNFMIELASALPIKTGFLLFVRSDFCPEKSSRKAIVGVSITVSNIIEYSKVRLLPALSSTVKDILPAESSVPRSTS